MNSGERRKAQVSSQLGDKMSQSDSFPCLSSDVDDPSLFEPLFVGQDYCDTDVNSNVEDGCN